VDNSELIKKEALLKIIKEEEFISVLIEEINEHNHNFYASPLPSAKELKELEKLYPNITKEMIELAKKFQEEEAKREERVLKVFEKDIDNSFTLAKRGQNIAVYFISMMFVFSGILLFKEQYGLGVTVLCATAGASIISSLMMNKKSKDKNG
jgi:uncharacterized membrane protein